MKKSVNYLSVALIAFFLVNPAQVVAHGVWESQWYAGLGLGLSRLKPDNNGTIFKVKDSSSGGYKLTLGYEWSERISSEVYYADLGKAKMSPTGKLEYQDFGISALYYFYQQEKAHHGIEVFAKAGVGFMKNNSDLNFKRVNNNHVMFGLGVGYGFDNGLMLRLDLDLFDRDSQFLSLNLIKRLGDTKETPIRKVIRDEVSIVEPQPENVVSVEKMAPPDSDDDGVIDNQDECPGTPTGAEVNPRGCASTWILQGVVFETNKDVLTADSRKTLSQVIEKLIAHQSKRHIQITGHTDNLGSASHNLQLSQQRAEAVLEYLVIGGVDFANMSAVGMGESQPIADNASVEGRAKNRRVELLWKSPSGQ